MEWKKDLYILVKNNFITELEYSNLILLPKIRDEVFFPDYDKYHYIPQEIIIYESELIIIFNMGLISIAANRVLAINYSFLKKTNNTLNGNINDLIFLWNNHSGLGNKIDFDLFVKKKFDISLDMKYQKIDNYIGNFEEKSKCCLKQIKNNYDKYAEKIISGEEWDRNSWRDLRD